MIPRFPILSSTLACAALAPGAFGQLRSGLERVDPGVEDIGPQQVSLRSFEIDLRSPLGFDLIYEGMRYDPYAGPNAPGRRFLTRSSGAVNAVFPRSSYVPTRSGQVPEIPAGTIFYIGDPAQILRGPAPAESAQQRSPDGPGPRAPGRLPRDPLDTRRDLSMPAQPARPGDAPRGTGAPTAMRVMSIWGNDEYRAERVKRLIENAADIETDGLDPAGAPKARARDAATPD